MWTEGKRGEEKGNTGDIKDQVNLGRPRASSIRQNLIDQNFDRNSTSNWSKLFKQLFKCLKTLKTALSLF